MEFYPDKGSISNDKGFINALTGIFSSCSQPTDLGRLWRGTILKQAITARFLWVEITFFHTFLWEPDGCSTYIEQKSVDGMKGDNNSIKSRLLLRVFKSKFFQKKTHTKSWHYIDIYPPLNLRILPLQNTSRQPMISY